MSYPFHILPSTHTWAVTKTKKKKKGRTIFLPLIKLLMLIAHKKWERVINQYKNTFKCTLYTHTHIYISSQTCIEYYVNLL